MLLTHAPRIPRPVAFARSLALAVFGEALFAVGGMGSGDVSLSSVETLSSAGGTWAEANPLNVPRFGCVGAPRP